MQLGHIELCKLEVSPANMRRYGRNPDLGNILPTIRSRGVIQPLLVRPKGESYEVVAGGRRYLSAKIVAEERGGIEPLPCAIMEPGDDAAALEASLIENFARLDPDEMTQYESFARLVKEGKTVEAIAQTFGITALMVKRRLALGNLLPKIRDAYRKEEIDVETIRHLTLASKAQQKEWLALFQDPEAHAPRGHDLKQWLFGGSAIATKVALFPLEEFEGEIVSDLFGEDGYFADTAQFWARQNTAIAARREQLLEEGWSEVIVLETGQQFHAWECQKTPKKHGGKVYVTITHRGEVAFHEGYLSTKEARRREQNGAGTADGAPAKAGRPELTSTLQSYVDLHRHAGVRLALLDHPGVALRLMVAHAVGGSGLWTVKAEPRQAKSGEIAASLAASAAEAAFVARRAEILGLLEIAGEDQMTAFGGSDPDRTCMIFAQLLKLSDEDVRRVLALVMAETLEAGSCLVEAIGVHLKVDLSTSWRPDDTFFDLVRERAVTNALLNEVAGKSVADANTAEKTRLQRQIIRDCLAGANGRTKVETWLPRWMAFPPRSYTDREGFRPVDEWNRVAHLFA
jgi:ParB family transcriptional regulator, chromosome partitioning protein